MFNKPGIPLFLAVILIAFLSIRLAITPASENKTATDKVFSVDRAYTHLLQIARAPHSLGTAENARVRAYIETVCRELGLSVEIQHTTGVTSYGSAVVAGNVYNIIARLKGEDNSKVILLSAHYDSQPNAVGAGDDGAGVAAMLETARLLKSGKPLKNDIVFLFTDGEEDGLLGAHGFVQNSPILKEVGIVLNFDNRGNSGVVNMFETNPGNGWVISGYSKSARHPRANSLSYEIYKTLPNSTDYTVFKEAGIAGLNNAFIEGFVNYHSMTDRPENLDRNSLQETGDNMVGLAKYFGDSRIIETKRGDATYFNVLGTWMVRYPAFLNIILLVLGNLMLIAFLVIGFRRKKIAVKGLIGGILIFLATLVVIFGLNHFFVLHIRDAHPLYDRFYGANSYNVYYYFFAMAALGLAIFSFIYQWVLRKSNLLSFLGSVLLVEMIATDILYVAAPTAIYFLLFPLLSVLVGYLILFRRNVDRPLAAAVVPVLFLIPAILFLAPLVYFIFVAFGLSDEASAVLILLGLLLGLLLPVFAGVFEVNRWLIPAAATVCCLVSLVMAYFRSGYTDKHPLQTNVRYIVDADAGKAFWTSDFETTDDWNRQFFLKRPVVKLPMGFSAALSNEAPLVNIAAPTLRLERDTIENGVRKVYFHCQGREEAIAARVILADSCVASRVVVDGKEVVLPAGRDGQSLMYKGLSKEGFDFMLELGEKIPIDLVLVDRSLGLPDIKGFTMGYPVDIIPGPDNNSNTIQVARHYRF